ncbi:cyclic nucleotide-binding domain-containing protein [Pseudothauera nasutitermitis]|uniref:Cyclic nucleotide-binding domain-containing protein n=1 Tax=Pseudothauera nasutitermitis TaxID=2565930 RepID=A0A4S4AZP3_9RHOO|nr:hemerythrin domain-containing protein [Pseudothauera nasutitermitis]THF65659.1 cyclic nucleotide-binding domain-containing protein [Pseudothauera nasutitermitis]
MQLLAWSDALKTDIDVIDRQHRGLVDMVNAAAGRLAGDASLGVEEVRLLLGYLKDYAEVHFGTEEALMALCGLNSEHACRHHENHERFLAHVGDMLDDLSENAVPDGRQLLAFLGDWLLRHIKGEDQELARRLRAAHLAAASTLNATRSEDDTQPGEPAPTRFTDMLARGSAALYATEEEVLELIAGDDHAALVIALDTALLPGEVLRANDAAARLFGLSPSALRGMGAAELFGPRQAESFPVLMSEVLVSGSFEGTLECAGAPGGAATYPARVSYLALHGQMVMLLVLEPAAGGAPVPQASDTADAEAPGIGGTVLSRHALFHDLHRGELAGLERAARLIRLNKGQTLFRRGDEPDGAYLVVSGQISLVVSNSRGAEKVLDIVDRQQVFGEVEALTRQRYRVSAYSLTATVLLLIPAAALQRLQATSLPFAAAAVQHLGARLQHVVGELEALTLHTAMERIIDHLLEHASINAHGVMEATLPAQKQVIASYLNISPPTLSRAFQQLTDNGLITINRRYVTIPDPGRLLRFRSQDPNA